MAAVAPPGPIQAPPSQNDIPGALNTVSWEGDKMFNIYIYDYCSKRGFRKTARELLLEAEIAPDATPPIDARQGLLFEWWSVFWVLFQAKSGGGSEDALVYTQHQAQRLASQRLQPPGTLSSASMPLGSQSAQPPLQSQQQQGQQIPQQMGRFVNGITRPGSTYMTNGPTPNGIITGMHGHPQLQPGVSFSVGPPLPSAQPQQPNGVPGGHGGPQQPLPPPGSVNPGTQPMPFNSLMSGQPQQQRQVPPLMNGHPQQQQRGPANNGPFQSPTMAHSPQNNASTPGHSGQPGPSSQPPPGQQQVQPPMSQFGGPSPNMAHAHMNMNRMDMLPPNGAMNPMASGPQQQQLPQQPGGPPTPGYSQQQQQGGGRPPSRTNTPGVMMHSSPSLDPRQPPPGGMGGGAVSESNINNEVMRIPQMAMTTLKRDLGLGDKNLATLTMADKNRIINAFRMRSTPGNRDPNQKPGQQDNNAAAGPSTGIMQAPGQQGQRGAPQQAQHPQPRIKRSSTSPGEEHETLPRTESSPPDRKRLRRSPAEQPTMQPISYPHHPQQQQQQQQQQGQGQQPPQQQQQQNLPPQQQNQSGQQTAPHIQMHSNQQQMMFRQMGLNGPIGPSSSLTGPVTQSQIGPGPTPLVNNSLMMHGAHGMHAAMYRQRMNVPNPQVGDPVFNPVGGPPGAGGGPGPQFNPGGLNRMGQNKPGIGGNMMPPPSPAMNGAPKDNNGGNGKDAGGNKGLGPGGNNNPGSPRNQPPSGGGGTAPPTPVPSSQPNPQQQQQLGNQNSLNPSPAAMMGVVPTGSGPGTGLVGGGSGLGGPTPDINTMFNPEFMNNMSSTMDDFAGTDLFRPDGDINFERDFGQWFISSDDVGTGLDMK